jgi:hypothetical protein
MATKPFSEIAAEMIAAGATFEELGALAITHFSTAMTAAAEEARDRDLGKFEKVDRTADTGFREILLQWVQLSVDEKTAWLKGMERVVVGPKVPLLLSELEHKFSEGQRPALFAAIKLCAEFEIPLPKWAADAFVEGYRRVERLELDSWDAAFGVPKQKSARLDALQRRRDLVWKVAHRVEMLRRTKPAQSLDWVYGQIATELGISVKMVRELSNAAMRKKPVDGLEAWRHVVASGARPRRKR